MANTTMNAQTIILKVNDMLKTMLEDYYDTIVNDVINVIDKDNEESNAENMKNLIIQSGLKERILNIGTEENIPVKINPVVTHNIPGESVIRSMKRKHIQAMCKIHSIPGRQKNEELIQQLLTKRQTQIDEGKQPVPDPEEESVKVDIQPPELVKPQKAKKMKKSKVKVVEIPLEDTFTPEIVDEDNEEEEIEEVKANIFEKAVIDNDENENEENKVKMFEKAIIDNEEEDEELGHIEDEELGHIEDEDNVWNDAFFEDSDDDDNEKLTADAYDSD